MSGQGKELFFRFDAASEIGVGHWRRCLALARACLAEGAVTHLLARARGLDWRASGLLPEMRVHELPWDAAPEEDARLLADYCREKGLRRGVVDHYRQDEAYQQTLRDAGLAWLQFGNPGHRHPLLGRWLHDATPGSCREFYESRLRDPGTKLLLGPRYALLQPEFALARRQRLAEARPNEVRKLLLVFGGGDDRGLTQAALGWLEAAAYAGVKVVLATSSNPSLPALRDLARRDASVELHVDNWQPAPLMTACDAALSTGGTTLHELACLGIPALVLSVAANQDAPAAAWERAGWGAFLGRWPDLDQRQAGERVRALLADADWRAAVAERCLAAQDGGGAGRVARTLLEEE